MPPENEESDDTGRTQVAATMPTHLRDAMMRNLDHGEFSERVRRMAQRIAFGEEVGDRHAIKAELQNEREHVDELQAHIESLQAEKREVQSRVNRLEERQDRLTSREDKFEAKLESLEQQLYSGNHVYESHGAVEGAANTGEMKPEHVIEKLVERNPHIPDHAFKKYGSTERKWDGIDGGESE